MKQLSCNQINFDASRHIWLTTISSAKGLEFRTVHLAGLDYLSRTGKRTKKIGIHWRNARPKQR